MKEEEYYLLNWILSSYAGSGSSLILVGDIDKISNFLRRLNKRIRFKKYARLTKTTEHKIIQNKLERRRSIFITKDLDDFVRTYLKSLNREETGNPNLGPKSLTPEEIYNFAKDFSVVNYDFDFDFEYLDTLDFPKSKTKLVQENNNIYLSELLSLYSGPEYFVESLINRVVDGENYDMMSTVPKSTACFKYKNNVYLRLPQLLEHWGDIFGYKCMFPEIEVKRCVWKISERVDLHGKYRLVNLKKVKNV